MSDAHQDQITSTCNVCYVFLSAPPLQILCFGRPGVGLHLVPGFRSRGPLLLENTQGALVNGLSGFSGFSLVCYIVLLHEIKLCHMSNTSEPK